MGNTQERFDIFDEHKNHLGTEARAEVHARGLWHQTFHCWLWTVVEGRVEVLIQQRHPEKDTFPGLLDISCAGHLLAGESVEDGVRELQEELGVTAAFSELIPCGVVEEEDIIAEDCIDREFCHIHLLRSDRPLEQYVLQPDEVTGLYKLGLEEFRSLADGRFEALTIQGVRLDENGVLIPYERTVSETDFVPHSSAYYRLVANAIKAAYPGK
ncbi:NUDIX domain-containing protein [Paenibacillus filicis]|uniref:NUDIX domain-containing protein n=1 Tax=Paenibacillus filicis TaxID=669464 RepID=A0ABU9DHQ1_9BACL